MVSCADAPTQPAASKINPAAPQFDLVNMPAGQVPWFDYLGYVDIVDENGHTIWQDVTQPLDGGSFVLEEYLPPPGIGWVSCNLVNGFQTRGCYPLHSGYQFISDPDLFLCDPGFGAPDLHVIGGRIAMYYFSESCFASVRFGNDWGFLAGRQWRITADAHAPGGRFFWRIEVSMIGLNGSPVRQVVPCAEGATSLTCTVTMPQEITDDNVPQFRVYYGLSYPFGGFLSPVDAPPTVNVAKAGSAVPVKFSLGSDLGLAILAAGSPSSVQVACAASSTVDDVEETSTASNSGLKYDAGSNQYTYVWKTEKSWAGTCRELRLAFTDNAPAKTAMFQFKK